MRRKHQSSNNTKARGTPRPMFTKGFIAISPKENPVYLRKITKLCNNKEHHRRASSLRHSTAAPYLFTGAMFLDSVAPRPRSKFISYFSKVHDLLPTSSQRLLHPSQTSSLLRLSECYVKSVTNGLTIVVVCAICKVPYQKLVA